MKMFVFFSILLHIVITDCLRESVAPPDPKFLDVNMPGVRPTQDDHYLCTFLNVEAYGTQYIQSYTPNSDADRAHHMLLFTCDDLDKTVAGQDWWDCGHHYSACRNMRIIYAWAKNAAPTILPKDVGFRIGPESNIKNLVLQVHYAHPLPVGTKDTSGFRVYVTPDEPKYLAGMMLLYRSSLLIPPHTDKIHGDMNCPLQTPAPIHPFAYRVHSHKLGVVIAGYRMDQNGEFEQIGKGNPQWPQAFYPITKNLTIYPNDYLAARCTYSTTNFENSTQIGQTAGDEMCNMYLMFYTESRDPEDHYLVCGDESMPEITAHLPADSDVPLPRNATLEEHAHGHHPGSGLSLSQTTVPSKSHTKKRPGAIAEPHQNEEGSELESPSSWDDNRGDGGRKLPDSEYKVVTNWPDTSVKLGQATGVDFDTTGNVVVFHRGDRTWDSDTFDTQNAYRHRNLGPIEVNTVLIIHPTTGQILHQWGKNIFYMPHDVTVDKIGNFWLTDVAMHQVLKFEPGATGPSMVLGTKFVSGNDDNHFCKPAAVAVLSNGDFFVADGYCNSRIIKFNSQGQKILQWGRQFQPSFFAGLLRRPPPPYAFQIPHALALAEDKNLLCVADRENGRIQCFNTINGTFEFKVESPAFGGRLFSVAYSKNNGGYLYAVNGPSRTSVQGFVIPISTRQIQSVFKPTGGAKFGNPHDISVSQDGNDIYVVEISQPYKVWKFSKNPRSGKADQASSPEDQPSPVVIPSSKIPVASIPSKPAQFLEDPPSDSTRLAKDESFSASVIIMAFLTIPLLLLITVGAIMRLMTSGWCRRRKESKSFAEFFPPSAGFEKLKMDESDSDNSESDIEEFAVSNLNSSYRKVPT